MARAAGAVAKSAAGAGSVNLLELLVPAWVNTSEVGGLLNKGRSFLDKFQRCRPFSIQPQKCTKGTKVKTPGLSGLLLCFYMPLRGLISLGHALKLRVLLRALPF